MWATVNVMGWGEQVYTPPPSICRPHGPLADLVKEVDGSSFLGQEGEISTSLIIIFHYTVCSCVHCSWGPVHQRLSAPLIGCLALCLTWKGDRQLSL